MEKSKKRQGRRGIVKNRKIRENLSKNREKSVKFVDFTMLFGESSGKA
ncbi:hypothetical protein IJ380_03360 [Candidatus Saccharibacteria bacterium]|nr:hypothetical protein [Candidatus Saccharibacteria bacterium]